MFKFLSSKSLLINHLTAQHIFIATIIRSLVFLITFKLYSKNKFFIIYNFFLIPFPKKFLNIGLIIGKSNTIARSSFFLLLVMESLIEATMKDFRIVDSVPSTYSIESRAVDLRYQVEIGCNPINQTTIGNFHVKPRHFRYQAPLFIKQSSS